MSLTEKMEVTTMRSTLVKAMRYVIPLSLLAVSVQLSAHHSVAGQFDYDQPLTLIGVISEVEWINPHIYMYLDVPDDSGAVSRWQLETLPTAMLRKAGITPEMLMADGATVTIEAIRARDESRQLAFVRLITYPEGHSYKLDF